MIKFTRMARENFLKSRGRSSQSLISRVTIMNTMITKEISKQKVRSVVRV